MCLFPWAARLDPEGGRPIPDKEGDLQLPCGKCHECLTLRSYSWAVRAKHEISCHEDNCFLTLSYDDDNLPSHLILKDPFQRFMKRLREKTKKKLKYMVSHEYGSSTFRPHHHCIIFGYSPENQKFLKNSKSGNPLFTSDEINDLWKYGFHSIGEANEKTAFYISAYALKGKTHTFTHNGESITVSDSFDCSKRPSIGLDYFMRNARQLVNVGDPLPRYYQKKLEEHFPDLFEEYQNKVQKNIRVRGTHEKLAKLTITNALKGMSDSEYRSAPDSKIDKQYEAYMKQDVKLYKEKSNV